MEGADTLYNTYWVRFPRGRVTFEGAVANTRNLIRAAEIAGVRRIVHTSITNASIDSRLPYFRGKGYVEEAIDRSRLSYAIVRPTVVFGTEDVLINNITWALRGFPAFPIFGSGDYRIQPVSVEDLARIAVSAGREQDNLVIDAVGPETYTFKELVWLIAERVGSRARLLHIRSGLALALTKVVGLLVNDVVLTRDEVEGLMAGLLVSERPPAGKALFSAWLAENSANIGRSYTSELARHYRPHME